MAVGLCYCIAFQHRIKCSYIQFVFKETQHCEIWEMVHLWQPRRSLDFRQTVQLHMFDLAVLCQKKWFLSRWLESNQQPFTCQVTTITTTHWRNLKQTNLSKFLKMSLYYFQSLWEKLSWSGKEKKRDNLSKSMCANLVKTNTLKAATADNRASINGLHEVSLWFFNKYFCYFGLLRLVW